MTAAPSASPRTLVLGIGNVLLSDEGVGVHVVQALRRRCRGRDDVDLLDGGTLSFDLAPPIAAADALLVVDAARLDAAPGTVAVFEGDAMDRFLDAGHRRSVHEVGLLDLLAVAALDGSLPERRALIGIQPRELGWGERPCTPVARAIPLACERALDLIAGWR